MQRLEPHEVAIVVGKRGSGKSYFAKALAKAEQTARARVVAFDPHDEYSVAGKRTAQVDLGPLLQRCTVEELIEAPEKLDAKRLSLAVVPEGCSSAELADAFREVAELVQATGHITLLADEVGEYSERGEDTINTLATQSRHSECPLVLVAQRMTQIPKTARTQASWVQIFLQSNPEDLEALVKLTGDKALAARVSRLPRRKSITWRDTTGVTTP